MKRSWCLVLWIAAVTVTALLIRNPLVHAADATATPPAGLPQNTVHIDDGTLTRLDFTQTVPALPTAAPATTGSAPAPTGSESKTTTVQLSVHPDVNLNITDLRSLILRLERAILGLTAQEFLDHYQDPKNDYRVSGCVTYCTDTKGTLQLDKTQKKPGCYISGKDPNDQYNRLNNAAQEFAAFSDPTYQLPPDAEGNYLHKTPIPLIVETPPPCAPGETGEKVSSTTLVPFSNGGQIAQTLLAYLLKYVDKLIHPQQTSKAVELIQYTPNRVPIRVLLGQHTGSLAYLSADDQKSVESANGGAYDAWLPAEQQVTTNNAAVDNFSVDDPVPIPINFTQDKTLLNYDTALLCSVTSGQDTTGDRPTDCPPLTSPTPSCTSELQNFSTTSCSLCNPQNIYNINNTFFKQSLPDGLPPTMIKIIEKAGEAYHVPPYSLLAVMFHEGGFYPASLKGNAWTEDNVKQWSICGGTMPFCNPTDVATMPYGIQPQSWTDAHLDTAASDILPERQGKENICNFLDQTFGAAKLLATKETYQLSPYISSTYIPDSECLGASISSLTPPTTPTSCTWSEPEVFRSHLQYAGYCPETGKTAGFPDVNDQYRAWIDLFYNNFSQCNQ